MNELLSEAKKRNEDLKYGKDEVLSVSGELGIVNQIEHLGRSYAGVFVHQYHVVEVGDVVYTKSPLKANPFGIIKLNKGKAGIVSTLYAVYKVNQLTAYGPFIDYYFSLDANTNRYLRPLVKKGAINTLQVTNEEAIRAEIFAPTIPEQKRIASFFTVLDKKIAELKQKKALLEQYKKGVMQKIFSQELRFKMINGKEFPKWENNNIGNLFEIKNGLNKEKEFFGKGTPIINFTDVFKKPTLTKEKIKGLVDVSEKELRNFSAKTGDVFFTRTSETIKEIGMAATLIEEIEDCVFSGFFLRARPKGNELINDYKRYCFSSESIRKEIITKSSYTTRALTSDTLLNKVVFWYPKSVEEQTKISNFLSAIEEKINRTENQIQQTEQYKKGLLQNMFI